MDHFALKEKEAYDYTRNIISTLNFQLPAEEEEEEIKRRRAEEQPLYSSEELLGLASKSYHYSLDVKMVQHAVICKSSCHSLWQIVMWLEHHMTVVLSPSSIRGCWCLLFVCPGN